VNNSQNIIDKNIKEIKEQININTINDNEKIDLRIKQNLFNSMIQKYKNISLKFSKEESDIKNIIETKLIRAAEIAVNQELNEEQRKIVIENPQMIQQMYENKLTGAAHIKLQNAVRDLEERHKDIQKLEKSILQIHNMIQELNALVKYQGEVIDNIEINIQKAKNYVFKAEKTLNCKYKCMKCCRDLQLKCLCCGVCCACCAACHCCTIF
jgi:t-SNARE complex subunit (syntaxin)